LKLKEKEAKKETKNRRSPLLWIAYAKYLKAESSFNEEDKEYQEEIFAAIRALEKAKALSKEKNRKLRGCALYFLGYFYYKSGDIPTTKENLIESIKTILKKEKQQSNTIDPSWWDWWLFSPFYRWTKRSAFTIISSSIFLLLLHALVPQVLSFMQLLLGSSLIEEKIGELEIL